MSKHTPGPWEVKQDAPHDFTLWSKSEKATSGLHNVARIFTKEANARLIAAAPELLGALKELYTACMIADVNEELSEYIDGSLLDQAGDAIAKAGSEQ